MYWLTTACAPTSVATRMVLAINRGQEATNAILDRAARYSRIREQFDDVRMVAFSWPGRWVRVFQGSFLAEILDTCEVNLLTLPASVELDRVPDTEVLPGVTTMQLVHAPGCSVPYVQFMLGISNNPTVHLQPVRLTSLAIPYSLIEQAAAGIMDVNATIPVT